MDRVSGNPEDGYAVQPWSFKENLLWTICLSLSPWMSKTVRLKKGGRAFQAEETSLAKTER